MELYIGQGRTWDIDSWMELVEQVKDGFPGLETREAMEAHRQTVLDFMARGEAICAKDGDAIVGALLCSKEENQLCFLAVGKAYRRQHVARRMVEYMKTILDAQRDIVVTTYRDGVPEGTAARAFYKRMGFVEGSLTEEFHSPVQEFIYREPYPIRRLNGDHIPQALELCWRVFLEFEAPEYSPEGIAAFRNSLDDPERTRRLRWYGAFDGTALVGVLCMRQPQHIGGFFVDAAYQRRGIGRRLFETMRRDYDEQGFTVHSSPYAVEVYRRLGFVATDGERVTDGLRYTPMRFEERLRLIRPAARYEAQVMAYREAMLKRGDELDGCADLGDVESFSQWMDFEGRQREKYGDDYVPSEVFLAVRNSDDALVGMITYRHPLSPFLLQYGGNIGYSVLPSERGKGYASEMLKRMLEICREYGEERVLISCDKKNLGSARTIQKNGGVLENEVADTVGLCGGGTIQRYWIELAETGGGQREKR